MKAVLLDTKTNNLSLSEVPIPSKDTIPSTHHLLKVHATAITNGELTWGSFVNWPSHHTPTYDVSGTILSSVPSSPFAPGDEVFGRIEASREGAAAHYATILPSETALAPKTLTPEEAATVPMSAETAWQALFEQAGLPAPDVEASDAENAQKAGGKRVLITGASGAVGMFAVQFAKLVGATVVGSCGTESVEFVKGLGADEVVDYRKMSVSEYVGGEEERKFDVVLEFVGKALGESWRVVRGDGVLISITPSWFELPEGGKPEGSTARGWFFVMRSDGEQLGKVARLIDDGKVKTVVDSVWPLEKFKDAFDRTASGRARGKVVLKL